MEQIADELHISKSDQGPNDHGGDQPAEHEQQRQKLHRGLFALEHGAHIDGEQEKIDRIDESHDEHKHRRAVPHTIWREDEVQDAEHEGDEEQANGARANGADPVILRSDALCEHDVLGLLLPVTNGVTDRSKACNAKSKGRIHSHGVRIVSTAFRQPERQPEEDAGQQRRVPRQTTVVSEPGALEPDKGQDVALRTALRAVVGCHWVLALHLAEVDVHRTVVPRRLRSPSQSHEDILERRGLQCVVADSEDVL
mmetsp:Transcript_45080/g.119632  ORF Transcript_45080/g.119632 Transcript_45080/m.119632 type:complete len:254 (-) Transcript_45080:2029-2790(-)